MRPRNVSRSVCLPHELNVRQIVIADQASIHVGGVIKNPLTRLAPMRTKEMSWMQILSAETSYSSELVRAPPGSALGEDAHNSLAFAQARGVLHLTPAIAKPQWITGRIEQH